MSTHAVLTPEIIASIEALEQWTPVQGYVGFYQVSSFGRVMSLRSGRYMTHTVDSHGYMQVALTRDKDTKRVLLHRLVLINFDGPPPFAGAQVNHKDRDKENNALSNLEWVDQQTNIRHMLAMHGPLIRGRSLTVQQQDDMRVMASSGATRRAIAERFHVSRRTVSKRINQGAGR